MAELALLDRAYHFTMQHFISTGQAPHSTELATGLGLAMEAGRQLLYDLIGSGIPAWLHPETVVWEHRMSAYCYCQRERHERGEDTHGNPAPRRNRRA